MLVIQNFTYKISLKDKHNENRSNVDDVKRNIQITAFLCRQKSLHRFTHQKGVFLLPLIVVARFVWAMTGGFSIELELEQKIFLPTIASKSIVKVIVVAAKLYCT